MYLTVSSRISAFSSFRFRICRAVGRCSYLPGSWGRDGLRVPSSPALPDVSNVSPEETLAAPGKR